MDIHCKRADSRLTDRQLQEIAGLIYETDPYIYPAMFKDRKEAEAVMPGMIRAGDPIFGTGNMFVAEDEDGGIAGVLLWKRGPVLWDPEIYHRCGGKARQIVRVVREYFHLFAETPEDMTSLVRIGIRKDLRGQHIGSRLMETFMRAEPGPYELYVLMDNTEAVRYFTGKGFRIRETRPGFSLDHSAYPCFWMVKGKD